jgi:hypothetical protein
MDNIDYEPAISLYEKMLELEQQLARQRQQLEDYAMANIQDRQELAACQADKKELLDMVAKWRTEAACSEAREKVLIEALNYCADNVPEFWTVPGVKDALNQPTDDSALRAALAVERERCIEEVCEIVHETWIVDAIRAPGD